ncbi:hypothetical protein AKO1_007806 [Acrasis kona]|uniref:Oxysterol-binding protein n=1 Tax=Acrasis kona TaxID=1008807 RepID=A0AAW2YNG4_9EUKA
MTTTNVAQLAQESYIYDPNTFFDKGSENKDSGSILFQFIKSLKPGMDMTQIMCPMFCIRPISFLEFLVVYTQPNKNLIQASKIADPEQRMVNIMAWVIATLTLTPQSGFAGIKPYNPILGEEFHCKFQHDDGSATVYNVEQVSHHPPITALNFINEQNNIRYISTGEFKAKFRGNYADSAVEGNHILELTSLGEAYEITWPNVVAKGILWGSAHVEHGGNLVIYCANTGYKAQVNFDHSNHKLEGHIYKEKTKVLKVAGELTGKITTQPEHDKKNKTVILDATAGITREKYIVPELTQQSEIESRRVWHPVTFAIKTGDSDRAAKNKIEIEENQRRIARARKESGQVFIPKLFVDSNQKTSTHVPVYSFKGDANKPLHIGYTDPSHQFNDSNSPHEPEPVNNIDLDLD